MDIPLLFGYVDFETAEGLLKCIRVMDGLEVYGKKLLVKPSAKTESFIKQWTDLKRRDWEGGYKQDGKIFFL